MKTAKEWLDECPGETDQAWDGGTAWFEKPTVEWLQRIQTDVLKWAAEQIKLSESRDKARDKIMRKINNMAAMPNTKVSNGGIKC